MWDAPGEVCRARARRACARRVGRSRRGVPGMGAPGMGAPCGVPRGDSFMREQFPMRASSTRVPSLVSARRPWLAVLVGAARTRGPGWLQVLYASLSGGR
ncbi:MAG: hypothetical protein BJ554DRAFT_7983 [Olpidium bornovanus]|uniref:Uncharacterized protein n=1 Tax=Olpidium bornovanus TaxID=278681 RepID=A0A8H7ZV56_9FUNG|nr:MAG: hypothetical protein BJ554DRAFT_7983 [Olpidium bornovanus]